MFHAGRLSEKPELLDANRYHGVLLTNTLPSDDEFLTQAHLPYPLVVFGRRIPGYCCVLEDSERVGRKAAEVLAASGCTRPAVLHGKLLTYTTRLRFEAFKQTGRTLFGKEPVAIVSSGLQPNHGTDALADFFNKGGECDGLFAVTDSLATGAYLSIKTSGRTIPRDISVVGIGDYGVAEYFDPALTTVAGANEAMVAEAIPLLFSLLRGESGPAQPLMVYPPTIVRNSTRKSK
jgi:LacI family transcriptional regulator